MSDPFVGEVRMFTGNVVPTGWAYCNGQLLSPTQNAVLYSIIGTTYGGDGLSTFAVPDLRGAVPVGAGQGVNLSNRTLGEAGGVSSVVLQTDEIPSHLHVMQCDGSGATSTSTPSPAVILGSEAGTPAYASGVAAAQLNDQTIAPAGGSGGHNNMQPFLTVAYIISLQGIVPARPDAN